MTRRQTLRTGILFGLGMAMAKLDVVSAKGDYLQVNLGDWRGVQFTLGKQTIHVSVAEMFAALKEGQR